ncbi:MAG: CNT family concentrative nucleoside transporter [Planctomycetota bacterium]|jgi:CNT family concentrative nucleoside transporter
MPILRALLGLAFFCGVAWLLSTDKKRINVRVVAGGILLQFGLALIILKTDWGAWVLNKLSTLATTILGFGEEGARMVFGPLLTGWNVVPVGPDANQPISFFTAEPAQIPEGLAAYAAPVSFAFGALTTIIYFSALMAILYHLGIVQFLVKILASTMRWTLKVSGAESLAMAANVFVGQTEAPLVVRPYIPTMTKSELMALMTGGFATIAGSVLAVYIGILGEEFAGHLLAASFMSAPAAFVMAKIMVPETETPVTADGAEIIEDEKDKPSNLLDAAAAGTSDGLHLYLNVVAMLIAFVALVGLINAGLGLIVIGGDPMSLQGIFGYVFAPVAYMMGVEWADCTSFGSLLGTKIAVNEFIAFSEMEAMRDTISTRSFTMAAYALCGFANFASVGIQIGGISSLAPGRRADLSKLALKAMLGGAFASWMTATIAGAFL